MISIFLYSSSNYYDKGKEYYQKKEYKKAFEIWNDLANKGDIKALNNIAIMYYKGYGVDFDQKKSVDILEDILKKEKNPEVMFNLAYIYYNGYYDNTKHETIIDRVKAKKLLEEAIKLGSKKANLFYEVKYVKKAKETNSTVAK